MTDTFEKPASNSEDKPEDNTPKLQEIKQAQQILDTLPEEQKRILVGMMSNQYYSGPVMPPKLLGELEKIIPGGAHRVLLLTEKEQTHRHTMETGQLDVYKWQAKYSLKGGIISFICLILGIIYCSAHGYTAGALGLTSIGAFGVISNIIDIPKFFHKDKK